MSPEDTKRELEAYFYKLDLKEQLMFYAEEVYFRDLFPFVDIPKKDEPDVSGSLCERRILRLPERTSPRAGPQETADEQGWEV